MDRRVLVWDGGHDYVNYKAALSAVGLEAVVSADREEAARCAALLLPGGGDIADRLPPEEERVIAAFTAAEKPILGICRGLQALNVFFGGTLYAYIPGHQSPEGDILHATRAVGELAELVGTEPLVNSNHHQAVHRLGAGLSVRQWAGDGVIDLSRVYATPRCPYWRCSGIRSVCAPARTARRCSDGYAAAWKRPPAVDNRGQKSL